MCAPPPPLLIAAASDLTPLQPALTTAVAQATGLRVQFTFAGSGILARQIENAAPYDIYLSANEGFVKDLESRGKLVTGSAVVYATGRLGLWSKSGKWKQLNDLTAPSLVHLALPNPAHAPYGAAAREMLQRLGLWAKLESRVVYGENVQQTLQFAASGNADACITAWSLVAARGGIQLPAADHAPIRQVGAVVARSTRKEDAARVLRFLISAEGRALLASHGLDAP
jgi:molybdate transport system substrate-binding protein